MAISAGYTAAAGDTITPTRLNGLAITNATMATNKVLGRTTAGTGAVEELSTTGSGSVVLATSPTIATPTITGAITASGGQIAFPATQVPSADANTLDDYEEGTWTPTLGGTATYTLQQGIYTKIGRLVHVHCRLSVNNIGTGSQTTISGLPFTAAVATAGVVSYFASAANSFTSMGCYTNGTDILMSGLTAAGASTATATFFTSSTDVMLSVTYHV